MMMMMMMMMMIVMMMMILVLLVLGCDALSEFIIRLNHCDRDDDDDCDG